jgi:HEAT repeat protein
VGESESAPIRRYLASVVGDIPEDSIRWKDVAEALGEIRHSTTLELHLKLLHHPNAEVRVEAVRSAGRAGHRALVPFLIRMLADRQFSAAAERTLQEFGPRIFGTLGDVLRDPGEPIDVRRAIPAVLAGIPHQDSVNLLLEALEDPDGKLRFEVIRALNKLRVREEAFRFDRGLLTRRIREDADKALAYRNALACLYPEPSRELLAQLLREKAQQARERVFRLLGLILPPATAHAAYNALLGEDRSRRAGATEYLDNALPEDLKRYVLPLIEERPAVPADDVKKILESFLQSGDFLLRECALDAIARNRWPEFPAADLPAAPRERRPVMGDTTPFEPLITEGAESRLRMTALQKAAFLRSFEPFSHATVEELLRLATIAKEVHFAPGDVLFLEGERADAIYLTVEGEVEVSRLGNSKKVRLGPRVPVGGYAVLARDPYPITARAGNDVFALKLDAEELYDMLAHNAEIVFSIFRMLIRKIGVDPRSWADLEAEISGAEVSTSAPGAEKEKS